MTLLVSIFGFAGRFAGDLLTTALGWASTLLFGRVPQKHQKYVLVLMALAFTWLLVVLAVLLPALASFLIDATPHPPSLDRAWLDVVLLDAVIVLPLLVGFAGWLVPAQGNRRDRLAVVGELLRGYILAPVVSGFLLFLGVVGLVRKVRSARHGWSDVHVPIVVKPRGYEQLVRDVQDTLASADLEVIGQDAPRVLMLPAEVLSKIAGRNISRFHQDRLIELRSETLRIGIYPSDIAISGTTRDRTRARASILSRLATTSAHLTTSSEAQAFEDRLDDLTERLSGGSRAPERIAAAFEDIDARLLALAVPTTEWDILYRMRLQLERDLLAGRRPGTDFPGDDREGAGTPASRRETATSGSARR